MNDPGYQLASADLVQSPSEPLAQALARAIDRWPTNLPLAIARRSTDRAWILALPRLTLRVEAPNPSQAPNSPAILCLDPATGSVRPSPIPTGPGAKLFEILEQAMDSIRPIRSRSAGAHAQSGFWIGSISYDLAGRCDPEVFRLPSQTESNWPLIEMHRCDDAWVLNDDGSLCAIGSPPKLIAPLAMQPPPPTPPITFRSAMGKAAYTQRVAAALKLIREGDIYEVNLAHQLVGSCPAHPPRQIARALLCAADPAHGSYLELPDQQHDQPGGQHRPRAIVSASPESFIHFDAKTRTLSARPMKGTRSVREGARAQLRDSAKERAELNMITDLMRNDLGRVCDLGSVSVPEPRMIETHAAGTLLQASSLVTGTLRDGISLIGALPELLPAGSITGAPKIRAMQVIAELEGFARGPWCGCCVLFEDSGDAHLSVAIRTALIESGTITYCVGAGIVADSLPEAEWAETLAKASVLNAIGTVEDSP